MNNSTRFVLLMIVGTVIGMLIDTHGPIGSLIYPAHTEGVAQPSGLQFPVLIAGTVAQALGLGVALALAANGGRVVAALQLALPGRRNLARAAFASLLWILGSWIPHVSLHQAADPRDLWSLAAIEWGFHITVVGAACVLARYVYVLAHAAPVAPSHREAGVVSKTQA